MEENICFCSSWNITALTVNTIQIDSILKSIFCPRGRRQTHPPLKVTTKKYDVVLINILLIMGAEFQEDTGDFYFDNPHDWEPSCILFHHTCRLNFVFFFTKLNMFPLYSQLIQKKHKLVHKNSASEKWASRPPPPLCSPHPTEQQATRAFCLFFYLKKLTGATCNLCLTVQMTRVQTTNPEDWFDVGQQVIIKSSLQRSFKHFYHKITTVKISKCYKCFTS